MSNDERGMSKGKNSSSYFRHSHFSIIILLVITDLHWLLAMADDQRFDLSERTAVFGEQIILFLKTLPRNEISRPLIQQLVRAATSIGANYAEADNSGSRKEFFHRISLCQRESRETMHWLRMIVAAVPESRDIVKVHWNEARELNCIFAAIHRK